MSVISILKKHPPHSKNPPQENPNFSSDYQSDLANFIPVIPIKLQYGSNLTQFISVIPF